MTDTLRPESATSPAETPSFAGDQKVGASVLAPIESEVVARNVDRIPSRIETWHLTGTTVVWSIGMLISAWLAVGDPRWLFAMSAMIIGQYVTDLFDGAVGRHRDTGLVKWGFFMDHLLDLVFAGAIVIGYALVAPPGLELAFLALLLITCSLMGLSFLQFAATNEFKITAMGVGPTEVRLSCVGLNLVLFVTGTAWLSWGVPLACVVGFGLLVSLAMSTQRDLWDRDMAAKAERLELG